MQDKTSNHTPIPTELNIAPRGKSWLHGQLIDGEHGYPTRQSMENAERAAFEKWARFFGTWDVERDDDPNFSTTGYTDITVNVAWLAWQARAALAATPAATESREELAHRLIGEVKTADAIATAICQRVAEFGDRSSPEDWPEAMLVTGDELHLIAREAVIEAQEAAAAPAAVAGSAPCTFLTEDRAREWAWDKVREEVGTQSWTAGESFNFHGFYLWGWNYRAQYELQRTATRAAVMQEILSAAPAAAAPVLDLESLTMPKNPHSAAGDPDRHVAWAQGAGAVFATVEAAIAAASAADAPARDGKLPGRLQRALNELRIDCKTDAVSSLEFEVRSAFEGMRTSLATVKSLYHAAQKRLDSVDAVQPDPFADAAAAAPVVLPEPIGAIAWNRDGARPTFHAGCRDKELLRARLDEGLSGGPYRTEFAFTEQQVRALLAQKIAIMPKGESAAAQLRAMATNYPTGHSWDKLDAKACIRGALEIEALRAQLATATGLPAQAAELPTVELIGIKDGKETSLGQVPMPPTMKARELLRDVGFSGLDDDDGDGAYAMGACEQLIEYCQSYYSHQARDAQWLQAVDMAALERFDETADDDQSYDIGKDAVTRLARFGCLQNHGFGQYSITAFGNYVLNNWSLARELPFKMQSERDAEHRAAVTAVKGE